MYKEARYKYRVDILLNKPFAFLTSSLPSSSSLLKLPWRKLTGPGLLLVCKVTNPTIWTDHVSYTTFGVNIEDDKDSPLCKTADVNFYHVTKFSPYFPFTLYCLCTKISSFMPVLTIGIEWFLF